MTEVILQVYPALGAEDQMAARRPIGRNNEAYQNMLAGLVELCQAADQLGYWGICHTEHHMHSEGMEISPAPLLLNLYLSRYTTRLRHGQLGLVLPSHDPIRLAEEIAIVDHMMGGRLFVGMVRGYQARWQNILCQRFDVTSTASDAGAADLLTYDGPTYQVPFPRDEVRARIRRSVELYEEPVWHGWYERFGFMEASRYDGEEGPVPKPGEHLADRLIDSGLLIGGTVDQVKRQVEGFLEKLPIAYFVWLYHWGMIPRDEALPMLELFGTEIMPEFGLTGAAPVAGS